MNFKRIVLIILSVIAAIIAGIVVQAIVSLPEVESLSEYIPSESSTIIADDNSQLARFHEEEYRRVVPMSQISPYLQKAAVAIEDERFYKHNGIDFIGISRALFKDILYGKMVEGGSTITQQLARNIYLTRSKTIGRKIAEIILALKIEKTLTKEEILEYYLNEIYFGHNCYGAEAASLLYFGKHASEINLAESAMIAGIIEGPELYSPYHNLNLAKARQKIVLNKMLEQKTISDGDYSIAINAPLFLKPENLKKRGRLGAYFTSYVYSELVKEYGEDAVNSGGLRVFSTLDSKMQAIAEDVTNKFIAEEGTKYKFSQVALVAIDPRTGEIKAMVGGANFGKSQFNRAVQMKRQPGSSFKPFIYTAALEDGISPGTVLSDRPKTYEVFRNKWNPFGKWSPKNFNKKFSGAVTMRDALERSLNLPSIDLLEKVGISKAIDTSRKMGITSDLTPGLALALGVCEVSPLEITSAMGTLPSGGVRREPFAIKKIENSDGSLVYEHEKKEIRVLEENIAYLMIDIMKGVLSRGTGYKGRLSRPAAAKTGTSQDFKDAWTIGFTPQLICGVWVGNDDNKPMQGVAEVSVCPRIFKAFMESALQNEPPLDFPHPTGMVDARICLSSGMLANPYCPRNLVVAGSFFKGKEPISECYIHPIAKDDENKDEDNQDQDPAAPETSNDTNTNNEEPAQ